MILITRISCTHNNSNTNIEGTSVLHIYCLRLTLQLLAFRCCPLFSPDVIGDLDSPFNDSMSMVRRAAGGSLQYSSSTEYYNTCSNMQYLECRITYCTVPNNTYKIKHVQHDVNEWISRFAPHPPPSPERAEASRPNKLFNPDVLIVLVVVP